MFGCKKKLFSYNIECKPVRLKYTFGEKMTCAYF